MNIVFLGDSTTDAGKSENACVSNAIGQGYAMIISAKLGKDQPILNEDELGKVSGGNNPIMTT